MYVCASQGWGQTKDIVILNGFHYKEHDQQGITQHRTPADQGTGFETGIRRWNPGSLVRILLQARKEANASNNIALIITMHSEKPSIKSEIGGVSMP